jgi:hypothetical protein
MTALPSPARDLSERLSAHALDVCRTYLSNGRRCGRYWSVGDVANSRGRSLYVRLIGPSHGPGAAGHWTDAATGEHGDLIDLIQANLGLSSVAEALQEARAFLNERCPQPSTGTAVPRNPSLLARRLFALGQPVPGTLAEAYLRARGITAPLDCDALRFHPSVYCRELGPDKTLPALLAAVTDLSGRVTAVQRTWLNAERVDKADLAEPRRSLGDQLGHGVRFGRARGVLLVGEGIETVLSLKSALPTMPMVAALSAHHLGALEHQPNLRRIYIARDRDRAGAAAASRVRERAEARGVAVIDLVPPSGDFNADLCQWGLDALRRRLLARLSPEDVEPISQGMQSR